MADAFDPYHRWLGISPKDQPPNHYRLLAIDLFEPHPDVIEHATDRQMAHLRTFQAGKHGAESQRLLNELATAKLCLLNPAKKAAYDAQLRAELARQQPIPQEIEPSSAVQFDFDVSLRPPATPPPAPVLGKAPQWPLAVGAAAGVCVLIGILTIAIRGGKPPLAKAQVAKPAAVQVVKTDPSAPTPTRETSIATPTNTGGSASRESAASPPLADPPRDRAAMPDRPPEPSQIGLPQKTQPPVAAKGMPKKRSAAVRSSPPPAAVPPPAERLETTAERLQAAFGGAKNAAEYRAVAEEALKLVDSATAAGNAGLAKQAATLAINAARKSDDAPLSNKTTLRFLELGEQK